MIDEHQVVLKILNPSVVVLKANIKHQKNLNQGCHKIKEELEPDFDVKAKVKVIKELELNSNVKVSVKTIKDL